MAVFQLASLLLLACYVSGQELRGAASPLNLADDDSTTLGPDDGSDTSTPGATESVPSILEDIKAALFDQMRTDKQWFNVAIATVCGAVLLVDGELMSSWMIVGVIVLLTVLLSLNEVTAIWGLGHHSKVRLLIGLEAGVIALWASFKSINGLMLCVGAVVGLLMAHGTQVATHLPIHLNDNPWVFVAYYSIFTFGCMWAVHIKKHVRLLAIIAPIIGGALLSSALSWSIAFAASTGHMQWLSHMLPNISVDKAGGAWIDFFVLLFSSHAKDVGVFVDSSYNYPACHLDRAIGCLFWAIFAAVGVISQVKRVKRKAGQAGVKRAKAREVGLSEPLVASHDSEE